MLNKRKQFSRVIHYEDNPYFTFKGVKYFLNDIYCDHINRPCIWLDKEYFIDIEYGINDKVILTEVMRRLRGEK